MSLRVTPCMRGSRRGRPTVVAQLGAAATALRRDPKGNADLSPRNRGTRRRGCYQLRPADTEHFHSQLPLIAGMLRAGAGGRQERSPRRRTHAVG
jgi:hypothetical protein